MTYIVFPSDLIGAFGESAAIAWSGQAVNFIVFWLSVAAARIAVVPLCRSAMAFVERPLPVDARGGAVYLLTVAAVLLLWYEGIVLSMEAAAFLTRGRFYCRRRNLGKGHDNFDGRNYRLSR